MSKNILISILILAAALRLFGLTRYPAGLNADEAALGYNAYSLLLTGRDEHGQQEGLPGQDFQTDPFQINAPQDDQKIPRRDEVRKDLNGRGHTEDFKHEPGQQNRGQQRQHRSRLAGDQLVPRYDADQHPERQAPHQENGSHSK